MLQPYPCNVLAIINLFLSVLVDVTDSGALKELQQPPPTMLNGYLNNDNYNIEHISEKVLLPVATSIKMQTLVRTFEN